MSDIKRIDISIYAHSNRLHFYKDGQSLNLRIYGPRDYHCDMSLSAMGNLADSIGMQRASFNKFIKQHSTASALISLINEEYDLRHHRLAIVRILNIGNIRHNQEIAELNASGHHHFPPPGNTYEVQGIGDVATLLTRAGTTKAEAEEISALFESRLNKTDHVLTTEGLISTVEHYANQPKNIANKTRLKAVASVLS